MYYVLWKNPNGGPLQTCYHDDSKGKCKSYASRFLTSHYIHTVYVADKAPAGNWILLLKRNMMEKQGKKYYSQWEECE